MMNFPLFLVIGVVLCLGVIILTAFLIILVLRRGSRAISQGVQKLEEESQSQASTVSDSRWAQADLKGKPNPSTMEAEVKPCPACGGENPSGAVMCGFCGRKL
ncbi:MAG: hypothetical protein FJZ98_00475 [Chloroflexi bacterium]|nr:hypothetical protein [Chloroflexota bacterium]